MLEEIKCRDVERSIQNRGRVWEVGRDRRTCAGGTPAQPHRRWLCRVSSGVSVLAVGGVVAEVRNGQNMAKKKAHSLGEGT